MRAGSSCKKVLKLCSPLAGGSAHQQNQTTFVRWSATIHNQNDCFLLRDGPHHAGKRWRDSSNGSWGTSILGTPFEPGRIICLCFLTCVTLLPPLLRPQHTLNPDTDPPIHPVELDESLSPRLRTSTQVLLPFLHPNYSYKRTLSFARSSTSRRSSKMRPGMQGARWLS